MSDDIVTRLRRHDHDWLPDTNTLCDYCDALAEIERLRAAGDALVKALRDETVNCTMAVFNETFVALNLWTEARREQ